MKILLLNQFYVPDVAPTGRVLHDLSRYLLRRGHTVTVLCSRGAYAGRERYPRDETLDGVCVHRVAAVGGGSPSLGGKFLDYVVFSLCVAVRLLRIRCRPDVVLSLTTPPYIGVLAKWVCRLRGWRHAHWIMDLYPDVLQAHGMFRTGSCVLRILQRLTRYELAGSVLTVCLGPDMAARVARYVTPPPGRTAGTSPVVHWVPLWADPSLAPWPAGMPNPMRVQRGWSDDEMVLLYSGNMGLGHRFEEFFQAAALLREQRKVRWVFAGGGNRLAEVQRLKAAAPELRVDILPYVQAGSLQAHLCSADVHLASLETDWSGCMIPSKIQGIFAVGKPVIFVGAAESSIARWILESGAGWVVREDDAAGLAAAARQAMDPAERARRGSAAREYAIRHFDMEGNCGRICGLLEETGAARA